jgi:hypothetical protein
MSTQKYYQLYPVHSNPTDAYILNSGSVYFFISEADKYAIKGNNLILGTTEIILSEMLSMNATRMETAVADASSEIKKLPKDKFISSLSTYSVSMNASMVIAKQVLLTNQIINKNMSSLKGNENKIRENAIEYYRIVSFLKKEYAKRRYPWLNALVDKFESSLLFKRGLAFERSAEPTIISEPISLKESELEFKKDTIICEEGTTGDEIFILRSGTIDVFISGNKVASVSEAGNVFGEMALLLGEKRTATLKAKSDVLINRIRRSELKNAATTQGGIMKSILSSLAKKHYYNLEKINSINSLLIEKSLHATDQGKNKDALDMQRHLIELMDLKKAVSAACENQKADFLQELVNGF